MAKTKIIIDYTKCGDGVGVDPRQCGRCLRACDPAVFLCHETLGVSQDPVDPQIWRITAVWLDLCNHCIKCVHECPQSAITVI
jgi:NAD-dependent dihydropyrimidine dehydrogenase PreA subunit